MSKVLVSDYVSDDGIKILEKEGFEVTYDYKLSRRNSEYYRRL